MQPAREENPSHAMTRDSRFKQSTYTWTRFNIHLLPFTFPVNQLIYRNYSIEALSFTLTAFDL